MVFKLGFIGGGINSAVGVTHKIAAQMDGFWQLSTGCFSRNHRINIETARQFGLNQNNIYSSWEKMLQAEAHQLDAIAILTPTTNHVEPVIKALELNIPVICEKALTTSYQEGKIICNAVKKNKGFLAITYNYSGYPMIRELQEMIKSGKLGKIHQIQIEMPQESFMRKSPSGKLPSPQDWRLLDVNIPTISLDLGVHLHQMIYFLTREKPEAVIAQQHTTGHFQNIIDDINALIQYSNNLMVQMWYSKTALGHRNGLKIRVYGDKGSAEWFQMNPEELFLNTQTGQRMIIDRASDVTITNQLRYNRFKSGHPAGFIEAFANLYTDFALFLKDFQEKSATEISPYFSGKIALEGLKLFEAINQSSREKQWITL